MDCKERLENYLRENGVAYQTQHHPLAYTAQEIAASEHVPGKLFAKVVMARADDKMLMVVAPATHRVDLAAVAREVGAREARLAREEEFQQSFPDCEVGAMPPFGNLYGVPVFVDESLSEDAYIVFQAGTHTDTMSMRYADYARLVQPKVGRFAHPAWAH